LLSTSALAQYDKPGKNNDESEKHSMNLFKVNLTAIVLKNYSFQYERILNRKFSFALGFRRMPNGKLPLQSSLQKIVGDDAEAQK
jgi:hypothetical protein